MIINNKNYQTVWMGNGAVYTIDQRLLPHEFKVSELKTTEEVAIAIKDMMIRGAPAIGAIAAYGVALSATSFKGDNLQTFHKHLENDSKLIKSTRPTAYDLFNSVDSIINKVKLLSTVDSAKKEAIETADNYVKNSLQGCKKIGEFGDKLIKDNFSILTHCNAGALATVDYGTALAPIRVAHHNGKHIHVFVDETRPRCQGSMLTAWELVQEKIPHSVIADNASGYFMKNGDIDLVIVGADRIAANGDVANKIGTYEKAVLAKENNIPFYVAAPLSTVDLNTPTGNEIIIEERGEEEVSHMQGWHQNKLVRVRIAPSESKMRNPAFDVTPAKYISGMITQKGIVKPENIKSLF